MDLPVHKTRLANGVRILTQSMPFVRSVAMGVWVNSGARDEAPSESGLSHLIEHMIFKGTRKRSAFDIAKEFDAVGGLTNAFTAMEMTCYHAKVLDTHLATMVDILSDIFLNSVFAEQELAKERPVIFQEIGMVEDSPDDYVHLLAGRTYWGDHPLGRSILGTPANLSRFNAETLKDFFNRFYQPDRIVISLAGNLTHGHIVDLVGPVFETIRPGSGFPERRPASGRSQVDCHARDLEQIHVCLSTKGLSITDPRRYALALLNTLLGGNMSSRLFQEIRERQGLAYAVYSFVAAYVDSGMFGVYVGVDPQNLHQALSLILAEMRKIKQAPLDADELAGAKEYMKGSLLLASESVENQMVRLAQSEINFGRYVEQSEVLTNIEAVSAAEVGALADELLRTDRLALTLLGPVDDRASIAEILHV